MSNNIIFYKFILNINIHYNIHIIIIYSLNFLKNIVTRIIYVYSTYNFINFCYHRVNIHYKFIDIYCLNLSTYILSYFVYFKKFIIIEYKLRNNNPFYKAKMVHHGISKIFIFIIYI